MAHIMSSAFAGESCQCQSPERLPSLAAADPWMLSCSYYEQMSWKSMSSRYTCNAQAAAQEEPEAAAALARGKHSKFWLSAVCVVIKAVSASQCPETAKG